jgi:hypothetical protein
MPPSNSDRLSGAALSGLAWYGRFCALGLLLCAIAALVIGILLITNNNPCNQWTTATVVQSCGVNSCCAVDPPNSSNYTCNLLLDYTINGTAYTNIPLTVHSSRLYSAGNKVDICYSTADAKQITLRQADTGTVGIIITVFGALGVFGLSLLNYHVWTNKDSAAKFGTFEVITKAFD